MRIDSFLVSSPQVPLTPNEADIGRSRGAEALDQMFAAQPPNLFDLVRRGLLDEDRLG